VAASLHGNGFGRAMMAEAEKNLRAFGCPKVNLQVRASNARAVGFYEALGYQIEERVSMGKRLGWSDTEIPLFVLRQDKRRFEVS